MPNGMLLVPRASLAWQHAFGTATPTAGGKRTGGGDPKRVGGSLISDVRRREFISLLGGATAWPLAARARWWCGGSERLDAPLRSAHLFEDLFAMLPEYAETFFERLER